MIKFREEDFINEVVEMTRASFYKQNKVYFWVSAIVSVFALLCSAWFSESFWTNVVGSQWLGLVITFMVSLIVYYVGGKVVKDYLRAGGFGVPVLLLIVLGGVNLYTDLHGVSYISKAKVEEPTNEQTNALDETFAANRKNYERRLNEQNAIIKTNASWAKYSGENGRWTKHNRYTKAQKEKAAVEKSLDDLIKAHTLQRDRSQQMYVAAVGDYNNEVDFLTTKYRYFASGCFVLFLGCLFVRVWFLSNVLLEGTNAQRTANESRTNVVQTVAPITPTPTPVPPTDKRTIIERPAKVTPVRVLKPTNNKKEMFMSYFKTEEGQGASYAELAAYCGASKSTVHGWAKEYKALYEVTKDVV